MLEQYLFPLLTDLENLEINFYQFLAKKDKTTRKPHTNIAYIRVQIIFAKGIFEFC